MSNISINIIFNIFFKMLFNLVLTIIIEFFTLFLLGEFNKNNIINVVVINCITNPILNYIMMGVIYFLSFNKIIVYCILIFLEIIVVFVECYFFKKNLMFIKKNMLLMSSLLNFSSFGFGLIIFLLYYT